MNLNRSKGSANKRALIYSGVFIFVLLAVAIGCVTQKSALINDTARTPYKTWTTYGGGPDLSKYTELDQFNKKNVNKMVVAWHYPTNDNIEYTFNPIVIDTIMYLMGKNNSLIALNALSGKELWIHANLNGITRKGLNYWESKDRKDRRLIFSLSNTLQEIDALSGKSIISFGTNGFISLKNDLERDPESISRASSTTPGQVFEDLIILGSSPGEGLFSAPGHIRAYNVITGKLAWVFHTIPLPGEFGYDTWPKDAYKYIGGVNTWGEMSVDEKRGIVYLPLGSPTYDYYGADRKGANLFSDCIVAVDARTGKRLWHFQTVHHDIWDYDITAAPQLITVKHNGELVDAVAVATKQGFLYAFNRVTGEPLWPIEERPVPKSNMPGEDSWPTQPFPTVLPPFTKQQVTVDDLNPYWEKAHADSMKMRVAAAKSGLYLPLSDKYEVISMPGAVGGANYGNTASNPKKGIVYVASMNHGSIYKLTKTERPTAAPLNSAATAAAQTAYVQNCQSCHGANREGGVGPALTGITNRLNLESFKTLVGTGKGQMPAFAHIDETTITSIYRYLGGSAAGGPPPNAARGGFGPARTPPVPAGPVVASGGAPEAQKFNAQRPTKIMTDYPDGIGANFDRYTTPYGLSNSDIVSPPWSTITAYDLNKGVVKWKKPLGQDARIPLKPGQENMGIPIGSQRKSMIVTSTGILFATARGGMLYAFDADNGKILWQYGLSKDTDGQMTTFQINGKQYLVVSAMGAMSREGTDRSKLPGAYPSGYMVFSLPSNK